MVSQISKVEALESRRMFDASAILADGVLTVTGTEGNDVIIFQLSPEDMELQVKLNKATFSFDPAEIDSVVVQTGGGNDKITVSEKNGRIIQSFDVDSGAGNDVIVLGSGDDTVESGDGNDKITSGAGDDSISAGNGNDKVTGGDDNDTFDGGAGNDKLDGGTGDDNLDGGDGKDNVKTGAGEDSVAVDENNPKELKEKKSDTDREYYVADIADLPTEIQDLHEEIIQGSEVLRVEISDGLISLYYRYLDDPQILKTVIDARGETLDLYSRDVSLLEAREPAITLFDSLYPGAEIKQILQRPMGFFDIRYRDVDGVIREVTTDNIVWNQDEADNDMNENGYQDSWENGNWGDPFDPNDDHGNEGPNDGPQV